MGRFGSGDWGLEIGSGMQWGPESDQTEIRKTWPKRLTSLGLNSFHDLFQPYNSVILTKSSVPGQDGKGLYKNSGVSNASENIHH